MTPRCGSPSTSGTSRAVARRAPTSASPRSPALSNLRGPVIYTPGDNEWTDCHRVNNGGYNPLERLDAHPARVLRRARRRPRAPPDGGGLAARISRERPLDRVAGGVRHSARRRQQQRPRAVDWPRPRPCPTAEQAAEVDARIAASPRAGSTPPSTRAESRALDGVVLAMQADTWQPAPAAAPSSAVVERIAARTAAFDGAGAAPAGRLPHATSSTTRSGSTTSPASSCTARRCHSSTCASRSTPATETLFTWERVQAEQTVERALAAAGSCSGDLGSSGGSPLGADPPLGGVPLARLRPFLGGRPSLGVVG